MRIFSPVSWHSVPLRIQPAMLEKATSGLQSLAITAATFRESLAKSVWLVRGLWCSEINFVEVEYSIFRRIHVVVEFRSDSCLCDLCLRNSWCGPLSRDYRGHAEVQGFFQHFMELSSGTFRLQVDHILAEGDVVVVLCTDSARRGDRSWSSPQVHVWMVRDGYAVTFRQYQVDQQTEDEFWSEPV